MGLFDGAFDPQAYGGQGIPGWLTSLLQNPQIAQSLSPSAGFGPGGSVDVSSRARTPDAMSSGLLPSIPSQTDREGMAGYSPMSAPQFGGAPLQPQMQQPMQMPPPIGMPQPPQQQPPAMPQPQSPQGPGFGDKMGAALSTLLTGPSLNVSGAAEAFGSGVTPQNQTIRALTKQGLDPDTAAVVARNPQLLSQVLQQTLGTKVTFGVIGKDKFGNDIHGFINTAKGTTTPANAGEANALKQDAGADPNLTGKAFLDTLDKPEADQVKAIVEGRLTPPGSFALKSPYWQRMLQSAAQYEPGFDMTKWSGRVATAKDFSSGQAAKNVTALNTVVGHLGDLMTKADALGNVNQGFGPLNQTANTIKNTYADMSGSPEVNNFRLARNAVSDEMAKVFRSSGMSDHEIQQWKSTINESMTPDQLKGAVKTGISLMESRLSALADQRNRGMATELEPRALLNPKSVETLKKVEDWAAGAERGSNTPAAPQITEGATATHPNGSKIIFKGGKWVPLQ